MISGFSKYSSSSFYVQDGFNSDTIGEDIVGGRIVNSCTSSSDSALLSAKENDSLHSEDFTVTTTSFIDVPNDIVAFAKKH